MTGSRLLRKRIAIFSLLILFTISHSALVPAAQKAGGIKPTAPNDQKKFDLTIDNIMRGPLLAGYEQTAVRWSADSQRLYFQWKQYSEAREKDPDTYVVNRDGKGLRKLSEEEAKNAPPGGGDQSRDKKFVTFIDNGDVFLYDNAAGRRRQ